MQKFIKEYRNKNEDRFNYSLINREYDDDLVEYIIDCCKSLEVLEYIKFLGYDDVNLSIKTNNDLMEIKLDKVENNYNDLLKRVIKVEEKQKNIERILERRD